jgi:hypothetical protein
MSSASLSSTATAAAAAAYNQTFGGALTDTDAYPANLPDCQFGDITWPSNATCIEDSQIQSELSSYIGAHSLSTGLGALYVIFTPSNVEVCVTSSPCAPSLFCSYHGYAGSTTNPVIDAVVPFATPRPERSART